MHKSGEFYSAIFTKRTHSKHFTSIKIKHFYYLQNKAYQTVKVFISCFNNLFQVINTII